MSERHSRQSFLGPRSEMVLSRIRVGIVGLGGGGSHIAQQLAHIGVTNIVLFDADTIEHSNLNRTVGARHEDAELGTRKVDIASRMIKEINPDARVEAIPAKWQTDFPRLRSCDIVFGCIDGIGPRAQLEETCRRALIPLIDIGMDVHAGNPYSITGQVATSIPRDLCLRCYGIVKDSALAAEGRRYGEAGGNPQVIWPNGVLASTAIGIFIQMITPWCAHQRESLLIGYDGDRMILEQDPRVPTLSPHGCPHYPAAEVGDPLWAQ